MKNANGASAQKPAGNNAVKRPEIRDDLDSRINEEQQTKGNDRTNNQKATKSAKKKK